MVMLPLLKSLSGGNECRTRDLVKYVSNEFNLTESEKEELLTSGQPIIDNRVGWARTYLKKAGLLDSPKRGYSKITAKGEEILKQNPPKIDVLFLTQFPDFNEFRKIRKEGSQDESIQHDEVEDETPDELIERGYTLINASLTQELLNKVRKTDPYFFEEVVGKLLNSMGYGKYEVTKKSNDGGIDGIVYQDKLGLDRIFFQAKRYDEHQTVEAKDVRDFVGTLDLNGVTKGVFITTSKFPKNTSEILGRTPKNIILIDGTRLAMLMIEHDVGVSTEKIYQIKRIDSDFFPEE